MTRRWPRKGPLFSPEAENRFRTLPSNSKHRLAKPKRKHPMAKMANRWFKSQKFFWSPIECIRWVCEQPPLAWFAPKQRAESRKVYK